MSVCRWCGSAEHPTHACDATAMMRRWSSTAKPSIAELAPPPRARVMWNPSTSSTPATKPDDAPVAARVDAATENLDAVNPYHSKANPRPQQRSAPHQESEPMSTETDTPATTSRNRTQVRCDSCLERCDTIAAFSEHNCFRGWRRLGRELLLLGRAIELHFARRVAFYGALELFRRVDAPVKRSHEAPGTHEAAEGDEPSNVGGESIDACKGRGPLVDELDASGRLLVACRDRDCAFCNRRRRAGVDPARAGLEPDETNGARAAGPR